MHIARTDRIALVMESTSSKWVSKVFIMDALKTQWQKKRRPLTIVVGVGQEAADGQAVSN